MRTRLTLAVVGATLAACGDEPSVEASATCLPANESHARICGLAPPRDGDAYKVTTVTGDSFWVTLPGEHARVVAVPTIPIPAKAELTTAPPREAADRYCDGFPKCRPRIVERSGAMTRWDDASGSIRDLGVTTVDLGGWTLVALEPIAASLQWRVDEDGYPRAAGIDGPAGVLLWVDHVVLDIAPGCTDGSRDLALNPPDTVAGGHWCTGDHRVDVAFADRAEIERLHASLRIEARSDGAG